MIAQQVSPPLNRVTWNREIHNYQLIFVNGNTENLFGFPKKDFFDNPDLWYDMMHPADKGKELLHINQVYAQGHSTCYYRVQLPDGSEKTILEEAFLITDDRQLPVGIKGTSTDVTPLVTEDSAPCSQAAEAVQDYSA